MKIIALLFQYSILAIFAWLVYDYFKYFDMTDPDLKNDFEI